MTRKEAEAAVVREALRAFENDLPQLLDDHPLTLAVARLAKLGGLYGSGSGAPPPDALFPYRMLLEWNQRKDGYWVADCPCGASLTGVEHKEERIGVEAWHFSEDNLDTKRNETIEKHRLAFAPENAAWLKKWFELSKRTWDAMRTARNYYEGTITAAETLPVQDKMRFELFAELPAFKKHAEYVRKNEPHRFEVPPPHIHDFKNDVCACGERDD